jgi:hypothetical protein
MSEDDIRQYRLTPEKLAQLAVVLGQIKKRRRQFVMVPWTWIEKLGTARYVATYRVALHVLYRHWRGRGEPFTLSNGMVAIEGVSRWQKWRALRELERLGLIAIERRPRRSPALPWSDERKT